MSVRFRSVISLAVFAALVSGCFPAVPPAGPYEPSPPPSPLAGTSWVLDTGTNIVTTQAAPAATTTTAGGTVAPAVAPGPIQASWLLPERGSHPTLSFSADRNAASGSTGCNRYFGNFSAGPNSLWFGGLATTKMMCFDALAVQEIAYLDALSKVSGYLNNGTSLTLSTSDGRQLTFTPLSTSIGTQAASYRYVCDDGLYFTANFDPAAQSAAIQVSTGATDTLAQEATGAAATYASQRHRLHAKGNEALLDTLYDGVTHHCVAPLSPQG
ncbi:MAG TPA: META domain-containing protein [Dongiaceae bacterium]|jgi:heat shock protein HslJ|nr:META domain-containing protein [Dongiaceae bacterium]